MTHDKAKILIKSAQGLGEARGWGMHEKLLYLIELAERAERERICNAIKAEDDYCVDNGDYMLDSDDCIAVAKGEWKRPDFSVDATRARSK